MVEKHAAATELAKVLTRASHCPTKPLSSACRCAGGRTAAAMPRISTTLPRAGAASRRVGVATGVTEDALSRDIGSVGHRRMIWIRVRPNVSS